MIRGIGIDVVDVADFARRIEQGTVLRAFSEDEQAYAASRPARRAEILAGRWAAREAFAKALGTGLRAEWPLAQMTIVRGERGQPELRLGPDLAHLLPADTRIHLSISHTPLSAAAVVILES